MSIWSDLYTRYIGHYGLGNERRYRVDKNFFSKEELILFRSLKDSDSRELKDYLLNEKQRIFVKVLVNNADFAPKCLTEPLVRASAYCKNPSFNKYYIKIPIRQNPKLVYQGLLKYVEFGTPFEIAGAINAFYWFACYISDNNNFVVEEKFKLKELMLKRFTDATSLDVQRSIISILNFDPNIYPERLRHLVEKAYDVASSHEDEYVQARFKIAMGKNNVFPPLPHREDKD